MNDTRLGAPFETKTVVLPAVVHRALIRNRLTYRDYLDFSKISKSLSSEDIKFWHAVSEKVDVGGQKLCQWLNGVFVYPDSTAQTPDHADSYYLATRNDLLEAETYLSQSNAMTENFYSLHREGTVLFVVVEEGFTLKLQESSLKLDFLKSYLKKLSEILPIHEVARNPLHIQYVSLVTS